jgi:zinc transporter
MTNDKGLVFACVLDGQGGARFGTWDLVAAWKPADGILWMHMDHRVQATRTWVREQSGLDEISTAAMLADETRPRATARGAGLLVNLRGVNLNPGSQPDDMISVRAWLEETRIITLRRRRLASIQDVRAALEAGNGPASAGEFLFDLGDQLLRRMATSFEDLDERIDLLQERIAAHPGAALRAEISDVRNQVIAMRRYLAPQRDAIVRLSMEKVAWLTDLDRERLREIGDRTTRRVEDLELARDRAGVASEELTNRIAEQMNRTMYVLAIVAAIFLPLGLLTGLLGINVAGMPGANDEAAFWIVCGILAALAGFEFWLFRKMHWL